MGHEKHWDMRTRFFQCCFFPLFVLRMTRLADFFGWLGKRCTTISDRGLWCRLSRPLQQLFSKILLSITNEKSGVEKFISISVLLHFFPEKKQNEKFANVSRRQISWGNVLSSIRSVTRSKLNKHYRFMSSLPFPNVSLANCFWLTRLRGWKWPLFPEVSILYFSTIYRTFLLTSQDELNHR